MAEERTNPLNPFGQTAWVRPLASIVALEYGSYFEDDRRKNTYYPLGPMKITFPDSTFEVPGPKGFAADDRDRANTFIKAIRTAVRF